MFGFNSIAEFPFAALSLQSPVTPSGSSGLSYGTGLYRIISGLWGGNRGLFGGHSGLKD